MYNYAQKLLIVISTVQATPMSLISPRNLVRKVFTKCTAITMGELRNKLSGVAQITRPILLAHCHVSLYHGREASRLFAVVLQERNRVERPGCSALSLGRTYMCCCSPVS